MKKSILKMIGTVLTILVVSIVSTGSIKANDIDSTGTGTGSIETIAFTQSGDLTMYIGDTYILDYKYLSEPDRVNWASTNSNLVQVNDGVVTALAVGDTTVQLTGYWTMENSDGENVVVSYSAEKVVHVIKSSMTLNKSIMTIGKESSKLIAQSTAKNAEVTWTTSDANIAEVENDGVFGGDTGKSVCIVTGVGKGECTITASTTDGTKQTCKVYVRPLTEEIVLTSPISQLTSIGQKVKVNVYQQPRDIYNKSIKWKSSNDKVATVDKDGYVTANNVLDDSYVTITAMATDGSGVEASIDINVVIPISELKPCMTKNTVSIGDRTQYTAVAYPFNITSGSTSSGITWSSDDTSIMEIDPTTGVSNAKEPGLVHLACDVKGVTREIEVQVRPRTLGTPKIKRNDYSKVTVKESANDVISYYNVQYSTKPDFSNSKSINIPADTNSNKVIKGLSKNKYYFRQRAVIKEENSIIYGFWSKTTSSDFSIKSSNVSAVAGQKGKVKASVKFDDKSYISGSKSSEIEFKSNNNKIVKVNKYTGEITGVKKGKCSVTISFGNKKKDISVIVNPSYNLKVAKNNLNIKKGKTYLLKSSVSNYNKKSGKKLSGISFSTSSSKIASVDKYTGKIKAKSKGKCYITVKYKNVLKKVNVVVK